MKIILKYILVNVKERKARSVVMMLSILLSSALLFVSFCIGASYESAQRKMAIGMAGSATVSVSPANGTGPISPDEIPDLESIGQKVKVLKSAALYHEKGYYETVDLIGAELDELNKINPPRLADGVQISDFTGRQIILPDRFTSKYHIEKGDTVTLQVNQKPVAFTVSEIAAYDTVFLRHTRGATALIPYSALREILGGEGGGSEILLEPAAGISTEELLYDLHENLAAEKYQVAQIVDEVQIEAGARQKSMPFFLISFFALTMSVFIIYSSYKVITLDRLPSIGTFRSIGATEKAVTGILLLESVLYGSVGGLLGIPAGMFALKLILRGLGKSLTEGIEIPVVMPVPVILLSFLVALAVSILSAWIPVRRASRLSVKDVVMGMVEERVVPKRFLMTAGVVLFILSVILPHLAEGNMLYLAGGISIVGMIASTIIIIPLVVDGLAACLEQLYGLIFKNEGRIAARNMKANKNTVQNITLLFISISAVIVISVVGDFVSTYITDVFRDAELQGFADGEVDQEFVEQVKQMNGVKTVLPLYVFKNEIKGEGDMFTRVEATDDLEAYSAMFGLNYTAKDMEKKAAAAFEKERTVILSEDCLKEKGVKIDDIITLAKDGVEKDYRVAGSFKSRATDVEAVVPSNYAVSDFHADSYGFLAYTAQDADAVMVQIRDLFADRPNWSRTVKEFNEDALSTVSAFLKPMHSMTYFILLLAAVGVINNLLINYIQKRRTIAMYKSIGLSHRQNVSIMLIEGFTSGVIGAAIAAGVSYLEIKTVFLVAGPKITMAPELELSMFFTSGAMGIAVTLAGTFIPIFKSRRMKLVEEIRYE